MRLQKISNVGAVWSKVEVYVKATSINRAPSCFNAHLVFKHTQKPDFLISNARYYSRFYGSLEQGREQK